MSTCHFCSVCHQLVLSTDQVACMQHPKHLMSASAMSLPCPALPCPALPCPALPCPHWPWQASLQIEFQLVMQKLMNHTILVLHVDLWSALSESLTCNDAATLTLSILIAGWVSVCHAMGQQPHLLHEAKVPHGQTYSGTSAAAAV